MSDSSWSSKTYTFSPSTTIKSAEVNQNFDDCINGINDAMPANTDGAGIIIWSGATANIPSGWNLCNGSSGRPDLRDRFVIGAGNTYAVDATGGASAINLQHSHTVNSHTHTGPSHTHTLTTSNAGAHNHGSATGTVVSPNQVGAAGSTHYTGDHQHSIGSDGGHTHTATTAASGTGNTGSSSPGTNNQLSTAQSILPPYFALAYIQKST